MVSQGDRVQVSVRIPLRQKVELETEAAEQGVSRSEYIRSILDERDRAEELAERLEIREQRIDELEEQLAKRSQIEEKVDVLARRVEDSEETANAPFLVRWWHWWRSR